MEDCREPKRALQGITGNGIRGIKRRKKWLDEEEDDLRKTGVKRWRIKTMDRTEWKKKICEAAKVLQEL
jgi:hypothetical protein